MFDCEVSLTVENEVLILKNKNIGFSSFLRHLLWLRLFDIL